MKVNVTETNKNERLLEVEVEAEAMDKAMEQAYRKLVKKYNIPGFRKGRAPRPILENYIGKGVLMEEALEQLLPASYAAAVKESQVVPVDRPSLELLEAAEGKSLRFKATVTVKPEVQLGAYKEIKVEKKPVKVTDEEIHQELEALRDRRAELVEVEGDEATTGRIAFIEYVLQAQGEPAQQPTIAAVEMGGETSYPEVQQALEGARVGEERTAKIKFAEDNPDESLRGKAVQMMIKVQGIKEKRLSELDDGFAKTVGEYETLEDLKTEIKNTLASHKTRRELHDREKQAMEQAVSQTQVDIPEVMIEREIDDIIGEIKYRLERAGLTIEGMYEHTGKDEAAVREEYKEAAEKRVKQYLVEDAIAKAEGIAAQEGDFEKVIQWQASAYGQKPEIIRKILMSRGGMEQVQGGIIRSKVAGLLLGEPWESLLGVQGEETEKQEG
ncbi:MAG: trigger factor [Bacillota bacterium]|jgi:trigger factor